MPHEQRQTFINLHKPRRGWRRLWYAAGYSLAGLRTAWRHIPFRLETIIATVLLPAAFALGRGWVEVTLLAGSVLLVLIVELLNSCIESVVDRIGPEWHLLSKEAKDMGSAAVFLSALLAGGIWIAALVQRFAG